MTIDVLTVSEADQRKLGCVSMPARPCAVGQVPATKVVLLAGAVPEKVTPGNNIDSRRLKNTFVDVIRSLMVPLLVQSTSVTNICVEV